MTPDILDLPDVRARLGRLSVEAYEAMTDLGLLAENQELIRGMLVTKLPKSPLHRKLARRIFLFLMAWQRGGFVVFIESPLRLADSVPEPDAMIVRGEETDFDTKHPTNAELVVEVALSSTELDRAKAALYAGAGVPEYWIVLAEERQVEVYRQPEGGVYRQQRLYAADETLACGSVPGLSAPLEDWFA